MKKLYLHIILVTAIVFNSCSASMHTVAEQPVAPVYERSVSPGAEYVWVDGDWNWHNGKYIFSNGYWAKPEKTVHGLMVNGCKQRRVIIGKKVTGNNKGAL